MTFIKIRFTNGLFYKKHLKNIMLNNKFAPFTCLHYCPLEAEE